MNKINGLKLAKQPVSVSTFFVERFEKTCKLQDAMSEEGKVSQAAKLCLKYCQHDPDVLQHLVFENVLDRCKIL